VLRAPELSPYPRPSRRAAARLERVIADAFARAASEVTREGDELVHEPASDWFAVALTAPAREGIWLAMLDARAALERMAAAMSLVTGRRIERGWWPLADGADIEDLRATARRALERGARERERYEFLATVGHELRTPLTSIRGYLETLLESDVDAETSKRFLATARNEALRLGRLVDGLLEFSALDLSAPPMASRTDLGTALGRALDTLGPAAAAAGMRVETSVPRVALARVDGDLCVHALVNVVQNAVKYGRRNGLIRVSVERESAMLLVHVDDDGRGIEPRDRERIFERGVRAHPAGEIPGSGLGLAIVRSIVERAGGSVTAGESPLGGARFTLALPSVRAESAAPPS